MAFSPDGKLLVSGRWDGTARMWETSSGRGRPALEFPGQPGGFPWRVESVAFSPDGRTFATSAGVVVASKTHGVGEVAVWSITKDQKVATLTGYGGMSTPRRLQPRRQIARDSG